MAKQSATIASQAERYWDGHQMEPLVELCKTDAAKNDPQALYYGGLAHHALNRKRDAVECWRRAVELKPGAEQPLRALVHELAHREDYIDAAGLFQRLAQIGKANADDWTVLGEIYIEQDRLAEARQCLQTALESEPSNTLALLGMASLYAHLRDRSAALDYLRRAQETDEVDLSDLASDPVFEFLWHDPVFEELVAE